MTLALSVALIASTVVAIFLGLLIWRHDNPPSGAYVAFSIFAAIPVVVLSLPKLVPLISGYCVDSPGGRYCLSESEIARKTLDTEKKVDTTFNALEQSVAAAPLVQESPTVMKSMKKRECRPYTYSNGNEPSPGLLVVGLGKNNWFPVVASIYQQSKAISVATELEKQDSNYPLEVHKASDANGNVVWAVTLGSGLSQEEAVARVCYAQNSKIFDKGSYAWASNKWGINIRSQ